LQNNSWIYFALHTDTMTILCRDEQPLDIPFKGVGKLSSSPGCKGYSISAVLQASSMVTSNLILKDGNLLPQVPLQYDCCEELGVTFNLTGSSLDVPHKNIILYLDDLKYASRKVSEKRNSKSRTGEIISLNTSPILL